MKNVNKKQKGENVMNAYITKPNAPFITKNELKRTPATEKNKQMVKFMDSHDFSFSVNSITKELMSHVTPKR